MWRKSAGIVFCASLHSAPHIKKKMTREEKIAGVFLA